jgi:hypothetical protein
MQNVPRLPVLLLITGAALSALHAQHTPQKSVAAHPLRIAYIAPYIPPVSGLPVSADYVIQIQEAPVGGQSETWHSTTLVARDSNGRIRHELREYVPPSFTKKPPSMCVVLLDPVARLIHTLDPVLQTDDRQWLHTSHMSHFDPGTSGGEDLGTRTIDGLEVRGERREWTSRPRTGAPGQPVQVVDEIWYSTELQLIVLEEQSNTSGGVVTISLSHLDRGEQSASLFTVPHGYHLPNQPVAPGDTRGRSHQSRRLGRCRRLGRKRTPASQGISRAIPRLIAPGCYFFGRDSGGTSPAVR